MPSGAQWGANLKKKAIPKRSGANSASEVGGKHRRSDPRTKLKCISLFTLQRWLFGLWVDSHGISQVVGDAVEELLGAGLVRQNLPFGHGVIGEEGC